MARSSHLFFGNPNNNDLGANEFNLNKEGHYSGGDLQGVINQLDYIQNLGVSAVWTALLLQTNGGQRRKLWRLSRLSIF